MKNKTLVHWLGIWVGVILVGFSNFAWSETKPKYGPQGAPRAITLVNDHGYFQDIHHEAPDFWAISGFYVPQQNDFSCSAASVAMVLNGARAKLERSSEDKVVTQAELLSRVKVENWSARLSERGWRGTAGKAKHGTSLDLLAKITEAAFKEFGFSKVQVNAIHVNAVSADARTALRKVLIENEMSDKDFVILNFNQKAFTDDADAGHIAPVGAFDEKKDRVLVFDPDRNWYEPYWVSLDTLLTGMATKDSESNQNRGYIWIKTQTP